MRIVADKGQDAVDEMRVTCDWLEESLKVGQVKKGIASSRSQTDKRKRQDGRDMMFGVLTPLHNMIPGQLVDLARETPTYQ